MEDFPAGVMLPFLVDSLWCSKNSCMITTKEVAAAFVCLPRSKKAFAGSHSHPSSSHFARVGGT